MSSQKKKYYKKDFESFFNVTYLKHNRIEDKRILEWDITQDKEYAINPRLNDRLEGQYGPLIDMGYCGKMSIQWINKLVEYGAFAEQEFKKGEMVTEYTGILEEDTGFDEDNLYLWDYPTILYKTIPDKKRKQKILFCINAEKSGNFARFINHSLRKYQNVAIQIVPRNGFWHVIYVAQRDIKKGEQLLTHYGISYWRDRQIIPFTIKP